MSKQGSCPRYHHYHHHHPRCRHHLHHHQRHHHRCRHHLDHLSQEAAFVGGGSRGPVGGTCIPRNMWGAAAQCGGGRPGFLPPATHFLMCFSRVDATLNGISQKRHLKISLPIRRWVFIWRVNLLLCAQLYVHI